MSFRRCRTLVLAGLLGAGLALPAAASPADPAPVRLIAPADGGTLQAGSLAELAWEPHGDFGLLASTEEWEAFLSLDGGAHYTVRITPHLDRDLRRVLWQVPAIPTHDARLLLRFGDEHVEKAYELPQRFAIAGPPVSCLSCFTAAPVRPAFGRGEPAFPGQAGVIAWVEGTRRGGSIRHVEATEPLSARSRPSLVENAARTVVFESTDEPTFDPEAEAGSAPQISPAERRRAALPPERTDPAAPLSILLQSRRRNE